MAITIGAPLEAVWPWLAQMGYGRAGWYTHAWIEGHPDPGRIHPQYQHIAEGDLVPDAPGGAITWTVAAAEEPRLLVYATARRLRSQRNVNPATPGKPTWYQASWAFILRPAGPDSTRLIVRWRHQLTPAYPALAPPRSSRSGPSTRSCTASSYAASNSAPRTPAGALRSQRR